MSFSCDAFVQILLIFVLLPSSICQLPFDAITPNQPIRDGHVLISSRKIFALGFFSPGNNSRHRYVGVWFNKLAEKTIVWVADRDNPVNDSSGVLSISGNLVLLESESSQRVLWQGFDHPSDTVLPYMKVGLNRRSGLDRFLTSWKSKDDDPGTGSCTYGIDTRGSPQLYVYKGGRLSWRSGPWIGDRWSGVPEISTIVGLLNVSFVNSEDETSVYIVADDSLFIRGVVDESGIYQRLVWNDQENQWIEMISHHEWCDNYGQCGPNGNCDPYKDYKFACTCLPGFEPKSPRDWSSGISVGGCVRKREASACLNGEGFVKVARVKVPDSSTARVNMSLSLKACELECLRSCSCTAYTSADERGGGIGCMIWHGDLMDMRIYPDVGQDLYVRVDAASLGKRRRNKDSFILTAGSSYFEESTGGTAFDDNRINSELALFRLKTIANATNDFSIDYKLGQGGFGSVYKGILKDGKEIAIKRLSKYSGQGVEEFKNEVLLIAKLQHRNLVRILGCCVEDEEKILIYEYLSNKSLDCFIFNETKRALLNWTRRFEIILGIARGVLYLHEDSRLRIIHRDLKASNVLLDNSLNPKIADFGMARIFRGEQSEANTNRVVGTYGYMSPEYAMEGLFSVKSDVYSFGVLLLEIITGKKNVGYYHEEYPNSNMVGHVWELWIEGKAVEIIDPSIGEPYLVSEVIRCIQIALLCVQEFAIDRPTLSAVVSMLGNDAALPSPGRPAFLTKRISPSGEPSGNEGAYSVNDVTCTIVEAR
ncbi:hypothetical protein ACLB2K_024782 [Fragaria x ananassa]